MTKEEEESKMFVMVSFMKTPFKSDKKFILFFARISRWLLPMLIFLKKIRWVRGAPKHLH